MEEKCNHLTNVERSIEAYLSQKTQESEVTMNKHLQALSEVSTQNENIFDSSISTNFFVSLYNLINSDPQKSESVWYCVEILTNACNKPSTRQTLTHTYQFIPGLTRLLGNHLDFANKIRLLKLMQDLSSGIKVSWQIPHLGNLLKTLAEWVESPNDAVATLSMGVLVNLCHMNISAYKSLTKHVDLKKFLRLCTPMKGPLMGMYTCKLVIIISYMEHIMEHTSQIEFIKNSFRSLIVAYNSRDVFLLRQIVDLFIDAMSNYLNAFKEYKGSETDIKKLLQTIENNENEISINKKSRKEKQLPTDPNCLALIFQFLTALVQVEIPELKCFHSDFIHLGKKWIQEDNCSLQALSMLRSIAIETEPEDYEILEPMLVVMPVILLPFKDTQATPNKRKVAILLQLLHVMSKVDKARVKILKELQIDDLSHIFPPLLDEENLSQTRTNNSSTCSMESINTNVFALALVRDLANYNANWTQYFNKLINNKQIQMILAQALQQSSTEVKTLVLQISSSPNFPTKSLSNAMENMQSIILNNYEEESQLPSKKRPRLTNDFPILPISQVEQVDETIAQVKKTFLEDRGSENLPICDVIELYEYKLMSMRNAEKSALESAEAASERAVQLQHRQAEQSAELQRLHQLFFHTQQQHAHAIKTIDLLKDSTRDLQNKVENTAVRLKTKEKDAENAKKLMEEINLQLKIINAERDQFEKNNVKLKAVVNKLETSCTRLENIVQKKDDFIAKLQQESKSKGEVMEIELQTKTKELEAARAEVLQKKEIISAISKYAAQS